MKLGAFALMFSAVVLGAAAGYALTDLELSGLYAPSPAVKEMQPLKDFAIDRQFGKTAHITVTAVAVQKTFKVMVYDPETEQSFGPMTQQEAEAVKQNYPHAEVILPNKYNVYDLPPIDRVEYEASPNEVVAQRWPEKTKAK